ncbi:unnamed protein product [Heterobilharzia americana]|nr:unnamed protein product [Heterobilharzia americana]
MNSSFANCNVSYKSSVFNFQYRYLEDNRNDIIQDIDFSSKGEMNRGLSSCFRCGEKLHRNDLIFQVDSDTLYHESCFTCYSCGRLLKCGDTYIMDGQTIQCSLHGSLVTNKQSFVMTKILASSLSNLFTAANHVDSSSSNSDPHILSTTNINLPELTGLMGPTTFKMDNHSVNGDLVECTTISRINSQNGMNKLSDQYGHLTVQNMDNNEEHSKVSLIPDQNISCNENVLNQMTNLQSSLNDVNLNYLNDYIVTNSKRLTTYTEVNESNIMGNDPNNNNNNNNNNNKIIHKSINLLPSIASSSSSPPLCPIRNYSNAVVIVDNNNNNNNSNNSLTKQSSFNARESNQNLGLNKTDMPILTHFFENYENKYDGKYKSVNKQHQRCVSENIKSQGMNKSIVKSSSLLRNGKLDQFKSVKSSKLNKKIEDERLTINDKIHGGRLDKNSGKMKRIRTSFKHQQLRIMKSYFEFSHNPDSKDLKQLSQKTGLSKRVLQVWFQNARAKFRRTSTNQVSSDNSKSNEPNSLSQFTIIQNKSIMNDITCENVINNKFYPDLKTYDYDEEKTENLYNRPVTSEYNIHLSSESNHNTTIQMGNNSSCQNDIKPDMNCLTSSLSVYTDTLPQSVR